MIRQVDAILKRLALWFLSALMRGGRNVATALVQLWAHKGRSMLTNLGIIIAVNSIITVVSFVEGFGTYVKNMMQGYGTQYIVVMPERQRGFSFARSRRIKLGIDDVEAVRAECPKVSRISPFVYIEVEVAFAGEQAGGIPMRGVNEHYQTIRNFSTDVGRFFGPVDIENEARVCVLGRTL